MQFKSLVRFVLNHPMIFGFKSFELFMLPLFLGATDFCSRFGDGSIRNITT